MSPSLLLAPAGVGLSQICARLDSASSVERSNLRVFQVEQQLLDDVDWDSGSFAFRSRPNPTMRDLLAGVTRIELMASWKAAFRQTFDHAAEAEKAGKTAIVAFHPSIYSARRSEQYSTIGWALSSGARLDVRRVVLLIDDIFDMWERLGAGRNDLFHHERWLTRRLEAQNLHHLFDEAEAKRRLTEPKWQDNPSESSDALDQVAADSAQAIINMLLSWRHLDMVEAESFASAVGISLATLGVKHPIRSLVALLENDAPTVYLSHPISRPRRAYAQTGTWPDVVEVSNALSASFADESVVLVCPTAIDEFRFERPSQPEKIYDRPFSLSSRWPLLVPGEDAIAANPHPSDRISHIPLTYPPTSEAPGVIARSLESTVFSEVPFRDHYLVTHTDSFFVFRPLYEEGKFSGGVAAEVTHWLDLATGSASRRALFVHTVEDVKLAVERVARQKASSILIVVQNMLRSDGLESQTIDALLSGDPIRAEMLDAESPDSEASALVMDSAFRRGAIELIFSALTSLPGSEVATDSVLIRIAADRTPSRSELSGYASFLRDGELRADRDLWVEQVESILGTSLEAWLKVAAALNNR